MPIIYHNNQKYLARWPKTWDEAILAVAQRDLEKARSDKLCNFPYKCNDLKFVNNSHCCCLGKLRKRDIDIDRHKKCLQKRSKISWKKAREKGDLAIIPPKYTTKDISIRYIQLKRSRSSEWLKKNREQSYKSFQKNKKKYKRISKKSRERRKELFKQLPKEIINDKGYPKRPEKKARPDTPENLKQRKYALSYRRKHYETFVKLQCKRAKLKNRINQEFLESLLNLEN